MKFSPLTPLLLVAGLTVLVAAPLGLYRLAGDAGEALTGTYLLLLAGVALLLLALDRFLVRRVAVRWLSVAEGLVLLLGYGFLAYDTRRTLLDLTAYEGPYFVVVWTNDPADAAPLQRVFPFDKTLAAVSGGRAVRLDRREFGNTEVRPPASWNGSYSSRGVALTHPRFESAYFYGPENHPFTPAQVDSLVRSEVARQAR